PCVNARSPATSTTLIVTGLFGSGGACVHPIAGAPASSTKTTQRRIRWPRKPRLARSATVAACSARSIVKMLPPDWLRIIREAAVTRVRHPVAARPKRRAAPRLDSLLGLLRADLLIPDTERFDLRLRRQRLRVRKFFQPAFVFRTAVLLDQILAFLRRHRQRNIFYGRTRVEVTLVVGVGLSLRCEQERHQVEHDRDFLRRHALRDH